MWCGLNKSYRVQWGKRGSCLYHHCVARGLKWGSSRWNFDPISFQAWDITTSGFRAAILCSGVQEDNRRSDLYHTCVAYCWKCGVSRWNFDSISFQAWDIATSGFRAAILFLRVYGYRKRYQHMLHCIGHHQKHGYSCWNFVDSPSVTKVMIVIANNNNARLGGQVGTFGFPPVSRRGKGLQSCVAHQKIPNWTAEE